MSVDMLVQVASFLILPFLAVILLAAVVFIAIRGGKPFNFNASGFGVSVGFNSNNTPPASAKEPT